MSRWAAWAFEVLPFGQIAHMRTQLKQAVVCYRPHYKELSTLRNLDEATWVSQTPPNLDQPVNHLNQGDGDTSPEYQSPHYTELISQKAESGKF